MSINSLKAELDAKEREIERLKQQLFFDQREANRLTQLVEQNAHPIRWGLRQKVRSFRFWLLPPYTRRERVVRNVYRSLRRLPPLELQPPTSPVVEIPTDPLDRSFQEITRFLSDFHKPPLVSIVIPAYNCLPYTRQCVESILRAEQNSPIEIVVVNNGSKDGTSHWLSYMCEWYSNFKTVENTENRGFSTAVNQGVEASRGDYVVIANNDLLMSQNWLTPLVHAMESDPNLGIVSPMTNYVGEGPQLDKEALDIRPEQVDEYALKLSQRDGQLIRVSDRLVFFCVMLRRNLFDQLGGLAGAAYGLGNFEDDDFCLRTRLEGYTLAIAPASFVFHFGSRTFKEQKISHDHLMGHNRTIFYERMANFSTNFSFVGRETPAKNIKVSVILRTQNKRKTLRKALISLANQTFRDFEVVLVNDGGEDASSLVDEFSRYMKCQYLQHDQASGPSAGLNSGLRIARGRWITYLDDDDILYPLHLELLTQPFLANSQVEAGFTYCHKTLCLRDEEDEIPLSRLPWILEKYNPEELLATNFIPIMTFLHAKSLVEKCGGFDESLEVLEDWDFLLRLSKQTEFHLIPHITAEYRFYASKGQQNSIIQKRKLLTPSIRKIYDRYPTDLPEILAKRQEVITVLEEQLAQLKRVEDYQLDDLVKGLVAINLTTGFPINAFRKDGFRA